MSIHEHLRRSGAWLFRRRSFLPLVGLTLLLIKEVGFRDPDMGRDEDFRWEAVCLAVGLLGLCVRLHVAGHASAGTSGRNTREQIAFDLNTTGLYSVMRHPLYAGSFLMWLGLVMFVQSWSSVLILVL